MIIPLKHVIMFTNVITDKAEDDNDHDQQSWK